MTFNWRTILGGVLVIAATVEMVEVIKSYRSGRVDQTELIGAAIGMLIVLAGAVYLTVTGQRKKKI